MANKFNKMSGLGAGLLNDKSKELATNDFQITYIDIEKLIPNEKNEGFSMNEIEDLKTSILEVGLEQNLVVAQNDDDTYKILTGHRRYMALSELVSEGNEKFKKVPCIVKDLSKIDLPIDAETKELYAIATTNAEVRKNTDADRLKLMEMLSIVYDKLKENGYGNLGRRRDFIAERLGVSSSTVKILSYVDKNLTEELKEDFKNEKIPLTVANELAHLDEKEQSKFIEKNEGDISDLTASDVKEHRKAVEEKQAKKKEKSESKTDTNKYTLIKDRFDFVYDLSIWLDDNDVDSYVVDGENYEKLQRAKKQIEKQYKIIKNILIKAEKITQSNLDDADKDTDLDEIIDLMENGVL